MLSYDPISGLEYVQTPRVKKDPNKIAEAGYLLGYRGKEAWDAEITWTMHYLRCADERKASPHLLTPDQCRDKDVWSKP